MKAVEANNGVIFLLSQPVDEQGPGPEMLVVQDVDIIQIRICGKGQMVQVAGQKIDFGFGKSFAHGPDCRSGGYQISNSVGSDQ
jgi:hypothetical protein